MDKGQDYPASHVNGTAPIINSKEMRLALALTPHKTMKKTNLPDFRGKVIQVSLVGDNHCYAMASPQFVKQGERLFLVGAIPRGGTSSNWSEGAVVAVVWDRVTDYMVFESAEVYRKGREKYRRHANRKS